MENEENQDDWGNLIEEIDQLDQRVQRLESIAHEGHHIPNETLDQIAQLVIARINQYIRTHYGQRKA